MMLHKQFEKEGKLDGKTYAEERWKEYEEFVIPDEAGDVQRAETKQAFLVGMACFFAALVHDPQQAFGSQEDFSKFLEEMQESLDDYIQERLIKLAVDEAKGIITEDDEEPTMQ